MSESGWPLLDGDENSSSSSCCVSYTFFRQKLKNAIFSFDEADSVCGPIET